MTVRSCPLAGRVVAAVLALLVTIGTTSCSTDPTPTPPTDRWRLVEAATLSSGSPVPFGATLLTRTSTRFVALGTAESGAITDWHSTDGEKWEYVDEPTFRPPAGSRYDVRHLVPLGEGAIAIGAETADEVGAGFSRMLAWISRDGIRWERDPTFPEYPPADFIGFGGLAGDGTSVVFHDASEHVLWREPATGWRSAALPDACIGSLAGYTELGAVLVGQIGGAAPDGTPLFGGAVVCTMTPSSDVQVVGDRTGLISAQDAASVDGITVAVGYAATAADERDARPVSTMTRDGRTWAPPVPLVVPEGFETPLVRGVARVEGVLVATGSAVGPGAVPIPMVWTSGDAARTWTAHALPALGEDGWISDVAADEGKVVILAQYGYGPVATPGLIVNF